MSASSKPPITELKKWSRNHPAEQPPLSSVVSAAIDNKKCIVIYYTKLNGKTHSYFLEPSEIKNGNLFGWDIDEERVKQFKMDSIQKITILNFSFDPRVKKS